MIRRPKKNPKKKLTFSVPNGENSVVSREMQYKKSFKTENMDDDIYIDFEAGPSSVPTWIQICTKYLNNRNPLINIIEKHVEKKT